MLMILKFNASRDILSTNVWPVSKFTIIMNLISGSGIKEMFLHERQHACYQEKMNEL